MEIVLLVGPVIVGLALLAAGGEALVRVATTIAEIAGVPPAVIGLTVIAGATSLPELAVSVLASLRGQPELAIANVLGSNTFNIAATLGITAVILPMPVRGSAVRLEWAAMLAASLLCLVVARDGVIDRAEGGVLLIVLVLFIGYTLRLARHDIGAVEERQLLAHVEARDVGLATTTDATRSLVTTIVLLAIGVVALAVGARVVLDGAVGLARVGGASERVIGVTIVAGGTGIPELATALVATFRKRSDVAVAMLIGSNVFNILGILGTMALIRPTPVSDVLVRSDMWWMIGTTLLLYPLMRSEGRLARGDGGLLLAAYGTYLAMLRLD